MKKTAHAANANHKAVLTAFVVRGDPGFPPSMGKEGKPLTMFSL
jgi:hypothetical protein